MSKENLNIGISLSGGGVRASVFHLGIIARIAEEGLLKQIKMTSTVSGGTLVMGLIYAANNYKWPNKTEYKNKCVPYVRKCLTEKNLQFNIILRTFFTPWNHYWGRAKVISKSINSVWRIKASLNDIPIRPRWNINSTTIESGKSWRFIPNIRMGDHKLNYVEKPEISLSDTMCSSAAVPMLLGPLILDTNKYNWFNYKGNEKVSVDQVYKRIHIWDGGAYDNLGLEALTKYKLGIKYRKEINFLIVCDASAGLILKKSGLFRPKRLIDVTMDQVRSLRIRALWNHFLTNKNTGIHIKIGEDFKTIDEIRKSENLSDFDTMSLKEAALSINRKNYLKRYPTTLWRMKEEDFDDLFRHGWEAANASLLSYTSDLFENIPYASY